MDFLCTPKACKTVSAFHTLSITLYCSAETASYFKTPLAQACNEPTNVAFLHTLDATSLCAAKCLRSLLHSESPAFLPKT